MKAHLQYARYLARHKWYVLVAGVRLGAPGGLLSWLPWLLRLVVHDWSKFLPSEWVPYVAYFYGSWRQKRNADGAPLILHPQGPIQQGFDVAWLLHQNRQPHHWQYWVLMEDNPQGPVERVIIPFEQGVSVNPARPAIVTSHGLMIHRVQQFRPLPMSPTLAREMVADWMGAGRAITGKWEVRAWYAKNRENIVLHPDTRALVERLLEAA